MSIIRHIANDNKEKVSAFSGGHTPTNNPPSILSGTFMALSERSTEDELVLGTWDSEGLTEDLSTTQGILADLAGTNLAILKNGNILVSYYNTTAPTNNLVLYNSNLTILASTRLEGLDLGRTNPAKRKIGVDKDGFMYFVRYETGNEFHSYLDGEEIDLVNGLNQNFSDAVDFNESMAIGGVNNDPPNTPVFLLNGNIADVRFWSRLRSQKQIQENKDKQLTGAEEALFAYYKFDEGTGDTISDSAGTYNGNLFGNVSDNMWSLDVPFSGANFSLILNGSDQYGLAAMNAYGSKLREFTFECWIKTASTDVITPAGVRSSSSNTMVFQPHLNRDESLNNISGKASLYLRDNSSDDRNRAYKDAQNYNNGEWHHFAWTKTNNDGQLLVTKVDPTDLSIVWERPIPDVGDETYFSTGMFLNSFWISTTSGSISTLSQVSIEEAELLRQLSLNISTEGRYEAATPLKDDKAAVISRRGNSEGEQDIKIIDNQLNVLQTINSFGSLGLTTIPESNFIESTINNRIIFNYRPSLGIHRMAHYNWSDNVIIDTIDFGSTNSTPNSLNVSGAQLALFGIGSGSGGDLKKIRVYDLIDKSIIVESTSLGAHRVKTHWTNWQLDFFE